MELFDRVKRSVGQLFVSEEEFEKRERGAEFSEGLHKLKFAVELANIEKSEKDIPYAGALAGTVGISGFTDNDKGVPHTHPLKLFYDIFESHTWTRTSIEAIAKAFKAVGYMVKSEEDGANKEEMKKLTEFFVKVNDKDESLDELLYKIVIDYLICGNAYMRVRYRRDGFVKHLDRLDPSNMFAIVDKFGKNLGWIYKAPGFDAVALQTKEVVQWKEHNPRNDVYGLPKMMNLLPAITSDLYVLQFNKNFFKNNASIGKIFEQDADDITIERNRLIFRKQYAGADNAHKNLILQSGKNQNGSMKLVYAGDKSAYEMGFIELRKSSREEVFGLFGVPMEVVGVGEAGALGGDTTAESFEVFHKNTISPMLEIIYGRFSRVFIQGIMGLKGVSIGPKDRQAYLSKGQAVAVYTAARTGVCKLNELREFLGKPPVEGGDILVIVRPDGIFPAKMGLREIDPKLNIDDLLQEMKEMNGPGKQMQDAAVDSNEVTPRGSSTRKGLITDVEILEIVSKSLGENFSSANKAVDADGEGDLWLLGGADPEMALEVEANAEGVALNVVGRGKIQSLGSIRAAKGRLTEYAEKLYA